MDKEINTKAGVIFGIIFILFWLGIYYLVYLNKREAHKELELAEYSLKVQRKQFALYQDCMDARRDLLDPVRSMDFCNDLAYPERKWSVEKLKECLAKNSDLPEICRAHYMQSP